MARILVESYMVRYPLGGMLSWVLQYLVGFHRLGHEVVLVERADHAYACFDPTLETSGEDCSYGVNAVAKLLSDVGLADNWCFVDNRGGHHGKTEDQLGQLFATADVFVQMTFEECWTELASSVPCRVLIDGDPGFRQIAMTKANHAGVSLPRYDAYFTTGLNVGTAVCPVPTTGVSWRPTLHPVSCSLFAPTPPPDGAFTTLMNWRSYDEVEFEGLLYGHKDVAIERFLDLPRRVATALELAVAGSDVPYERLAQHGWRVRDGYEVSLSFGTFADYIGSSMGEFSVSKSGYVSSNSGWFSDRSGAYLASGRPVVLQDTGFSDHLPCGEGLLAVRTIEEAVDAIEEVTADRKRHGLAARALAMEHLEATRVLRRLLDEVGL